MFSGPEHEEGGCDVQNPKGLAEAGQERRLYRPGTGTLLQVNINNKSRRMVVSDDRDTFYHSQKHNKDN